MTSRLFVRRRCRLGVFLLFGSFLTQDVALSQDFTHSELRCSAACMQIAARDASGGARGGPSVPDPELENRYVALADRADGLNTADSVLLYVTIELPAAVAKDAVNLMLPLGGGVATDLIDKAITRLDEQSHHDVALTRDDALRIGAAEVVARCLGTGARAAYLLDELKGGALPMLNNVKLDESWIVFAEHPVVGIRSSDIVLVSRMTGEVLYAGSLHDEGRREEAQRDSPERSQAMNAGRS